MLFMVGTHEQRIAVLTSTQLHIVANGASHVMSGECDMGYM